jgi:hypothetical protein
VLLRFAVLASVFIALVPAQDQPASNPVAQLVEQKLRSNPNDLTTRLVLADLYTKPNQPSLLLPQLLWLVANHPESDLVLRLLNQSAGAFTTPEASALAKSSWESVLATGNANATADYAAGLFFQSTDANRALQLFTTAHELYPGNLYFLDAEAKIYRNLSNPTPKI